MHGEGVIHRDLKLENLCMGVDSSFFQLYLIDFGLAKKYIDPANSKHIPLKSGKSLLGSIEYASLNNHTGKGRLELSRAISTGRHRVHRVPADAHVPGEPSLGPPD